MAVTQVWQTACLLSEFTHPYSSQLIPHVGSLTLPMALSVAMIVGGGAGAWWCARRKVVKMGGLLGARAS